LCSCYPWPLLGLPPIWYKSSAYRARTVANPRSVLRELGLDIADDIEVRIWDSNAASRYLVLPERPSGTQALGEAALADLVTRDAMIGVARVTGSRYYEHWLAALERLVEDKRLACSSELVERRDAWAEAYAHTPHGEPVRLR
jgi:hypothetical protein